LQGNWCRYEFGIDRAQHKMKQPYKVSLVLLLLIHLTWITSYAQFDAGPNDTINPGVPVNLTSSYGAIGNGFTLKEDAVKGPFPIGFTFSFFGVSHTQFYVGANGWISFAPNPNAAGSREAFAIPNTMPYFPKDCILGPFQDLKTDEGDSTFIFYLTIDTVPNRKLVVMFCQAPMFHCTDSLVTFQIILKEGSNTIENQIFRKPSCPDWFNNHATQGVQNANGLIGYAVPGRNASSWTASQEGWLYTPTSVDSFQITQIPYHLQPMVPGNKVLYTWYQGRDLLSSTQTITVTPGETTTYRAFIDLCDGEIFTDTVTVVVVPAMPNGFTPNGDGLNDIFRIRGVQPENITKFNFQIYDRWGQVIFYTNNILEGWDGTYKGKESPPGVYVWVIYYEDNKKQKISNKGTITLVR
jgi:gliding motility-associated-like protein